VVRSGGFEEGSGVRHLRPSCDHIAGGLEIQALSSASSSRSDPQSDGRQESAAEVSSESKQAVALRYFSHRATSYLSVVGRGMQGKVEDTTGVV
jgi:hypothetical protein